MTQIRLATRTDFSDIIELLSGYFDESVYGSHVKELPDPQRCSQILFQLMHQGRIWLAYRDCELLGVLAVIREPNLWFPNKISLREVIWYVKPEARQGQAAGRLFLSYKLWAEQLLELGQIEAYFMTEMATTDSLNLQRRGFRLAENLYIKD